MAPKIVPVTSAAGHRPHRRSEVNTKPRKKSSSAKGAMTVTRKAAAKSAAVRAVPPSSSGSSSWGPMSTSAE